MIMNASETILWTIFLLASSLISTTQCDDNKQARGICTMYTRTVCCSAFEFKNGNCTRCPTGYNSKINSTCKSCTNNTFGEKCKHKCTCNINERCNHLDGSCIHDDRITGEKKDKSSADTATTSRKIPPLKRPHTTQAEKYTPQMKCTSFNLMKTAINDGGDVVIYMTCVAVISVLVVVCGLIVKNREAICKHKSGKTSVKHLIHKLKQPTFNDRHNKKVAESLYDEIDEKYMINFDGE